MATSHTIFVPSWDPGVIGYGATTVNTPLSV